MPKLPPLVTPAAALTRDEITRYSRQMIISDVHADGQKRLKNAKVLGVGAGGPGSLVLMYLAAAGVGTLGIVESDVVDESQLWQQIVHRQSDVGRPRAESARDAMREINPYVQVNPHGQRLDADNALALLGGYDLVVDGTDDPATGYLIDDACATLGKPYVWGSIRHFEGRASVFWAEHGPRYRDLHPGPAPGSPEPRPADGAALGPLYAVIGSVLATEAIKLITGVGETLLGRLLVHDILTMECRTTTISATRTAAGTVSPTELKRMLDRGDPIDLIDIREPAEWEIVNISGARLVPKGEWLDGSALSSLRPDRRPVFYCRTGIRSAAVLAVARQAGFTDAAHLEGGVVAWARQIDPSLPVY